jgi:hypothetical protein
MLSILPLMAAKWTHFGIFITNQQYRENNYVFMSVGGDTCSCTFPQCMLQLKKH